MIEFKNQSSVLGSVRRCAQNYKMIEDGDVIAVGASGGKDSTALLCVLALLRRFYPVKYAVKAISVDLGFEGMDFSPLTELCKSLEVEHIIVKTEISEVVFKCRFLHVPFS